MEAFQLANLQETLAGKIVLSIGCNTKSDADMMAAGELTESLKHQLDELHKRKIDLADEILVLNVGGYIGESTWSEVVYAKKHNKVIRWLEPKLPPPPPSRTINDQYGETAESIERRQQWKLLIETWKANHEGTRS